MGASNQSQFLQRLNELIFDEEKIVTCLSLSSELRISLDDAKNLLQVFHQKSSTEDLGVTYLLCGTLKENKGLAVYLVEEVNLQVREELFSNISGKIIYSVQKSKNINFDHIALANCTHNDYTGYFVSKNCIKRSLKNKVQLPSENVNGDSKHFKEATMFDIAKLKLSSEESKKNLSSQKQSLPKSRQNGGIASFFTKGQGKINNKPTVVQEKAHPVGESSKIVEETFKETEIKPNIKIIEDQSPTEKLLADLNEVPQETSKETVQKTKTQINNKKRKKSNKNNNPNKKRKRIEEICDSDSSDIFDDNEEEGDVIDKSEDEPEPPPVRILSPVKNRRRKAIDKTYVDEEGFIVTTTEYVYEDASDEENEKPKMNTQQLPKSEVATVKPVAGKGKQNKKQNMGKQAILTNFFKKT